METAPNMRRPRGKQESIDANELRRKDEADASMDRQIRKKKNALETRDHGAETERLWGFLKENRAQIQEKVVSLVPTLRFSSRPVPESYDESHLPFIIINGKSVREKLDGMKASAKSAKEIVKINTALQLLEQQQELMIQFLKARGEVAMQRAPTVVEPKDIKDVSAIEAPPPLPAGARKGESLEARELAEAKDTWARLVSWREKIAQIGTEKGSSIDTLEFKGRIPDSFKLTVTGLECVNLEDVLGQMSGKDEFSYEVGLLKNYRKLYDRFYGMILKLRRGAPATEAQPLHEIGEKHTAMGVVNAQAEVARKMPVRAPIQAEENRGVMKVARKVAAKKSFNESFDYMKSKPRAAETPREKAEMLWNELRTKRDDLKDITRDAGLVVKFESNVWRDPTSQQFTGETEGLEILNRKQLNAMYSIRGSEVKNRAMEKVKEYENLLSEYKNAVAEMRSANKRNEVTQKIAREVRVPVEVKEEKPTAAEVESSFDFMKSKPRATETPREKAELLWNELRGARDTLQDEARDAGLVVKFESNVWRDPTSQQFTGSAEGLEILNRTQLEAMISIKGSGAKRRAMEKVKEYERLLAQYKAVLKEWRPNAPKARAFKEIEIAVKGPQEQWKRLVEIRDRLEGMRISTGKTIAFVGDAPREYNGSVQGLEISNVKNIEKLFEAAGRTEDLAEVRNYVELLEEYMDALNVESQKERKSNPFSFQTKHVFSQSAFEGMSERHRNRVLESSEFMDAFRDVTSRRGIDVLSAPEKTIVLLMEEALVRAYNALEVMVQDEGIKLDKEGKPTWGMRWFNGRKLSESSNYKKLRAMDEAYDHLKKLREERGY